MKLSELLPFHGKKVFVQFGKPYQVMKETRGDIAPLVVVHEQQGVPITTAFMKGTISVTDAGVTLAYTGEDMGQPEVGSLLLGLNPDLIDYVTVAGERAGAASRIMMP